MVVSKVIQTALLWGFAGFGLLATGYWFREFIGFRHGYTEGYQKALDDVYARVDPQLEDCETAEEKTPYTHGMITAYRAVHMALRDMEDGR